MNLRTRLKDMLDSGIEVRPWLLFAFALMVSGGIVSALLLQTIGDGLTINEVALLSDGVVELWMNFHASIVLPDSGLSLGLLNLPLTSLESARLFQALLALLAMAALFELTRIYYDARYGLLAVVLATLSNVFLATATTLSAVWLSFIVLVAAILALLRLRRGHWLGYVSLPLLAGALVSFGTLGAALALATVAAIGYSIYKHRLQRPNYWTIAGMGISFSLVVAGYWLLARAADWRQLLESFALPQLSTFIDTLQLHTVGGQNPFGWPLDWPLWNIAYIGLVLLGASVAIRRREATRYKLTLLLSGIYVLSWSLPWSDLSFALGVLVGTLLITAGLRYLIQSWADILPRNRIRHVVTAVLIVSLLLVVFNGSLTRRFVLRDASQAEEAKTSPQSGQRLYQQFRQSADDTL